MNEPVAKIEGSEKVDDRSSASQNETNEIMETDEAIMEYPTKFKLVMIVVALVLSMFLVCEDQHNLLLCSQTANIPVGISGHG
jgi:hypothetical protein